MMATLFVTLCMTLTMISCGGDDDEEVVLSPPTNPGGSGNQQATGITGSVIDDIVMTDGYMVYLKFNSAVKGYHHTSMSKSNFDKKSEEQIINDLKTRQKWEQTEDTLYHYTTNLPAGSTRVFCMVCFDANGNYGPLVTRIFTTKLPSSVWDAPCQIAATATEWQLNVTKQSGCEKYYLLTTANATQAAESNTLPNIVLARRFKEQMKKHADFVPKTDDLNKTKPREANQTAMFAMTWGVNAQGEFSGNICRSFASTEATTARSCAPRYDWHHTDGIYDIYCDAD